MVRDACSAQRHLFVSEVHALRHRVFSSWLKVVAEHGGESFVGHCILFEISGEVGTVRNHLIGGGECAESLCHGFRTFVVQFLVVEHREG